MLNVFQFHICGADLSTENSSYKANEVTFLEFALIAQDLDGVGCEFLLVPYLVEWVCLDSENE